MSNSSTVPCETPANYIPSGEGNYLIYRGWRTNAEFLFLNHLLIVLILKKLLGKIIKIHPFLILLQEKLILQK